MTASAACVAVSPVPAPIPGISGVMAVGDFEVVLRGPGSGLWRHGVRLGAPLLCWPCSAVSEGAEIGGWLLRHPGSASLLCIEVRVLMGLGPGWLASRLLAHKYAFSAPVRACAVEGFLWQCWLQRLAATPQGVLKAGSPEACRALKAPVWQEVVHG